MWSCWSWASSTLAVVVLQGVTVLAGQGFLLVSEIELVCKDWRERGEIRGHLVSLSSSAAASDLTAALSRENN